MPELPEVELTVRDLKTKVLHRTFVDVWADTPKLIKKPSNFSDFKKGLKDKEIRDIFRLGKNILFKLSDNFILLVHQKLTGHLLYGEWKREGNEWVGLTKELLDKMNRFLRVIFFLDNGKQIGLSDLRKFAKIELIEERELSDLPEIKEIGIDPFSKEFTFPKFKEIVSKNKRPIKVILTDQKLIAGIGNIYSSEILFDARVHPLRKGNTLSERELKNLFKSTKKLLKIGIKLGGASIPDYRRLDGSKGRFDKYRKVYRREGKPCPRCKTPIKRIVIGGRSAYFCPYCQKL